MGARGALALVALAALIPCCLASGAEAGGGDRCEGVGHAGEEEPGEPQEEAQEVDELKVALLQTGLKRVGRRRSTADAAATREQEAPRPTTPQARGRGKVPFLTLPPCKQHYWLPHLAEQSRTWCDPRRVPSDVRAPPKLQGLFWLNGLPLPDVAACFSRGIWSKEHRTLRVNVWSDFVFRDTTVAEVFESQIFKADMHYAVRFSDDSLSNATLHPEGSGLYLFGMQVFDVVSDFPMTELTALQAPGERWVRPSYFGLGNFKVKVNDYSLWRILDGRLQVIENNVHAMVTSLDPQEKGVHLSRFSADCLSEKACDRDTGGTCNAFRCHRWRGQVECINHGFTWHCICEQGHCAVSGRCVRVGGRSASRASAGPSKLPA